MKLIVGLGNPGIKYENTRHNMGFMFLDRLADDLEVTSFKEGFKGYSGECVLEFINYFKIDINDIVILLDDLALEPGRFRMRLNGSSGGQKGLQNIIDLLHTSNIKRIRIGVGEPYGENIVDYVLSSPSKDEMSKIDDAIDAALLALKYYIATSDFSKAMSKFNTNKVV